MNEYFNEEKIQEYTVSGNCKEEDKKGIENKSIEQIFRDEFNKIEYGNEKGVRIDKDAKDKENELGL